MITPAGIECYNVSFDARTARYGNRPDRIREPRVAAWHQDGKGKGERRHLSALASRTDDRNLSTD